ncbi:hypothetical protein AD929_15745 [Gluconobacter potus]|uniref:Uncharacterized protein n=1 Tax=Gluconobacter potus TaxID=2724927 RepID=A0A149QQ50_9PROT|nr:hypothetical protein AD929_15745 [Gluconobacter potus]
MAEIKQLTVTLRAYRRWWFLPACYLYQWLLIARMALFGLPLSIAKRKMSGCIDALGRKGVYVTVES